MNPAEVIPSEVQRQGGFQVLQLLGECVCEPRKPAKLHADREVLAFDMRCGNQPKLRVAADWDRPRIDDQMLNRVRHAANPACWIWPRFRLAPKRGFLFLANNSSSLAVVKIFVKQLDKLQAHTVSFNHERRN